MKDVDFSWLTEHGREVHEKYAGKWIAVFDCKVVGVGSTAIEAAEAAEKVHPDADFLFERVDHSFDWPLLNWQVPE